MLASVGDRRRFSLADLKDLSGRSNEEDDDDEPIAIVRFTDPTLRALIINFFKTFEGASMRDSVFGLNIAGMIDHMRASTKAIAAFCTGCPAQLAFRTGKDLSRT